MDKLLIACVKFRRKNIENNDETLKAAGDSADNDPSFVEDMTENFTNFWMCPRIANFLKEKKLPSARLSFIR